MMRWGWALLGILCFLSPITTSAHAECAWVLWVEESWIATYKQDERPSKWTLVEVHPLREACRNGQTYKVKELAKEEGVTVHGNILAKTFSSGYQQSSVIRHDRVICVPDTVDPRGPKGK